MMKKKRINPFHQIRWKLALVYTLTTLCVFFMTELILTVSSTQQAFQNDTFANTLFLLARQEGNNLIPDLVQDEIPQARLQAFVEERFPFQAKLNPRVQRPPGEVPEAPPDVRQEINDPPLSSSYSASKSSITITDENGIIQATNQPDNFSVNQSIYDSLSLVEANFLMEALSANFFGDIDYLYGNNQTLYLAVPLINQFDMVGMIYLQVYSPSIFESISHAFRFFIPRIPTLLLVSALVGLFFGFLSARSITWRLDHVAESAEKWGEGDFSTRIGETQKDEVGEFTRELDQMADRFEELLHSKEQLATLEERNRLARDLHDSVKQQLFAVNMTLAAASALWKKQPDKAYERLEVTRKLSQQAQDELSDLIRTLRPLELTERPLMEAIGEYLQDWKRQTHIAAVLEQEGEGVLAPEAEKAVYRIFQEALSNIARHSKATAISLSITYSAEWMNLVIHDNGIGFYTPDVKRGIGLDSMRERAESCGGSFKLISNGNGTKIKISIPLLAQPGEDVENE